MNKIDQNTGTQNLRYIYSKLRQRNPIAETQVYEIQEYTG